MSRLSIAALVVLVAAAAVFTGGVVTRGISGGGAAPAPAARPPVAVARHPVPRRMHTAVTERPRAGGDVAAALVDPPVRDTTSPWTVVILGPGDLPLEGICVAIDDEEDDKHVFTDAEGVAVLPWKQDESALRVEIDGYVPIDWPVLTEKRTVVRYPDLVPLEIRFVDALNGGVLRGGGVVAHGEYGRRRTLERDGDVFRMFPAPFARGDHDGGVFGFEPPRGTRGEDAEYTSLLVSPLTDTLRLDIPVWPVGQLHVTVRDADGRPLAGALVKPPRLSGFQAYGAESETDADGGATFVDVPMVTDEVLHVDARTGDRYALAMSRPIAPSQTQVYVTVDLPREPVERPGALRGCGGAGMSFVRRLSDMPDGGEREFSVTVLLRDGRPALHEVTASGASTTITLREPAGEDVRVRVVTPDGRPVASAAVTAKIHSLGVGAAWRYAEIRGGVQTGILLTDADGSVTLRGIAHAKLDVEAELGSREAKGRAAPGEEVTLVLRGGRRARAWGLRAARARRRPGSQAKRLSGAQALRRRGWTWRVRVARRGA